MSVTPEPPVALNKRISYENLVVECPWCGRANIFNRVSDLKTHDPISSRLVTCLLDDCRKPFRITGDSVYPAHEMLIDDCYELLDRKQYVNCILTLTQAYEMFFSLYLRVELLYKPFAASPAHDRVEFNRLHDLLQEKLANLSFGPLRALFLYYVTSRRPPKNIFEAQRLVESLTVPPLLEESDINRVDDVDLMRVLKALRRTTINKLRNDVVHKTAHRPTFDEVEAALQETQFILLGLNSHLKLRDDLNWYMSRQAVADGLPPA